MKYIVCTFCIFGAFASIAHSAESTKKEPQKNFPAFKNLPKKKGSSNFLSGLGKILKYTSLFKAIVTNTLGKEVSLFSSSSFKSLNQLNAFPEQPFKSRFLEDSGSNVTYPQFIDPPFHSSRILSGMTIPDTLIDTYAQQNPFVYIPAMAPLNNGGFVSVWLSETSGNTDLYGRIYSSSGVAQGSVFRITNEVSTKKELPSLAVLNNGNIVVVWQSGPTSNYRPSVFGQLLSPDGTLIGTPFSISTSTAPDKWDSIAKVTPLTDGGFLVAWNSHNAGTFEIHERSFNANGPIGGPEQLLSNALYNSVHASVVRSLNGDIAIIWLNTGSTTIEGRIYDQYFIPYTGPFSISSFTNVQEFPCITALNNGNFALAWERTNQTDSLRDVYSNILSPSPSVSITPDSRVNTYVTDDQSAPSISALQDGRYVIAWRGKDQSGDWGIYAQAFYPDGTPIGSEFRVNQNSADAQSNPNVMTLNDGGFIITWQRPSVSDASLIEIYSRRFNANLDPIPMETVVCYPATKLCKERNEYNIYNVTQFSLYNATLEECLPVGLLNHTKKDYEDLISSLKVNHTQEINSIYANHTQNLTQIQQHYDALIEKAKNSQNTPSKNILTRSASAFGAVLQNSGISSAVIEDIFSNQAVVDGTMNGFGNFIHELTALGAISSGLALYILLGGKYMGHEGKFFDKKTGALTGSLKQYDQELNAFFLLYFVFMPVYNCIQGQETLHTLSNRYAQNFCWSSTKSISLRSVLQSKTSWDTSTIAVLDRLGINLVKLFLMSGITTLSSNPSQGYTCEILKNLIFIVVASSTSGFVDWLRKIIYDDLLVLLNKSKGTHCIVNYKALGKTQEFCWQDEQLEYFTLKHAQHKLLVNPSFVINKDPQGQPFYSLQAKKSSQEQDQPLIPYVFDTLQDLYNIKDTYPPVPISPKKSPFCTSKNGLGLCMFTQMPEKTGIYNMNTGQKLTLKFDASNFKIAFDPAQRKVHLLKNFRDKDIVIGAYELYAKDHETLAREITSVPLSSEFVIKTPSAMKYSITKLERKAQKLEKLRRGNTSAQPLAIRTVVVINGAEEIYSPQPMNHIWTPVQHLYGALKQKCCPSRQKASLPSSIQEIESTSPSLKKSRESFSYHSAPLSSKELLIFDLQASET